MKSIEDKVFVKIDPLLMGLAGNKVKNGVFNLPFTADELTAKLKPVAGKPLHFSIEGTDDVE
jgi:hypothetical protein